MKITMKTLWSSPSGTRKPGDTFDVPATLGKELIARRYAVPANADPAKKAAAAAKPAPAPTVDEDDDRPAPSASKKAWVAWVVAEHGVDETIAKGLTRRELIAIDEAGGLEDDGDGDGEDDEGDGDEGDGDGDEDGEE